MPLDGAAVIETDPFQDHRGQFARFFCEEELRPLLGDRAIAQMNFSSNRRRGTLRGMHFQKPPHTDAKFVRCIRGRTYHVVLDIRPDSSTYLRWEATELSARQMNMICVPEGFAHGFQSLEDDCELIYLVTSPYCAGQQGGLRYDDPALRISWPLDVTELSERDARHPLIEESQGAAA